MTIICRAEHSQYEEWIYMREDGTLIYHVENDGWTARRKGLQLHEQVVSVEEAVRRFPNDATAIRAAVNRQGT